MAALAISQRSAAGIDPYALLRPACQRKNTTACKAGPFRPSYLNQNALRVQKEPGPRLNGLRG
jgi:hypothetical protein